jgi:hypothetical protein
LSRQDKRVKLHGTRVDGGEMTYIEETLNEFTSKDINELKWSGKH